MVLVQRQGIAVEFIEIIDGLLYIVLFQVFISFVNVFDPIYWLSRIRNKHVSSYRTHTSHNKQFTSRISSNPNPSVTKSRKPSKTRHSRNRNCPHGLIITIKRPNPQPTRINKQHRTPIPQNHKPPIKILPIHFPPQQLPTQHRRGPMRPFRAWVRDPNRRVPICLSNIVE